MPQHILGLTGSMQENLRQSASPEHYAALRLLNISQTRKDIAALSRTDFALIQEVHAWQDLATTCASLLTRLREWYSLYDPEKARPASDQSLLDLAEQCSIRTDNSMGAAFSPEQITALKHFANLTRTLSSETSTLQTNVEKNMHAIAPNLAAVATPLLGAQLLCHAGSLKGLARLPSSTIQLIGAEKALFRHMVTGSKCPKHGVIIQHPLVQKASNRGKASAVIAGKIAIAVKVDAYGGKFIGDKLLEKTRKRLGQ